MKHRRVLIVAALALTIGACGGGAQPAGGSGSGGAGEGDVVLTVYEGSKIVHEWTLAELRDQLEFVTLEIDGDQQNGPRLLDVLAASGAAGWTTAEVLGKGESRAFDVGVEVSSTEVDDGWILDVTNRGTLKLAAAALPRDQWVRDAGEIRLP